MNLLANNLIEEGYQVTLFAANKSAPDLVEPKFQIIEGSRALTSGLVGTLPMIIRFRQQLVTNKYDWVILNCELPELLGVFTPFSNKLILVEHNERPWLGRSLLGYVVRQILAARKSINVSVSPHTLMWPRGQTPDFIIPNMVLMPPSVQISKSSKLKRLVFIGRLTEQKNPRMFIDIVKESGLSGVLIGEGELRGELQSVIDEERLPCQIIGHQVDP
jgi:glycosyltransferase involved in cell wall biosynthesis